MRFNGIARGSLCVVYTRDNEPSGDDLRLIGILAAALAQEEERTAAVEALREKEQFIRSIFDNVDQGFIAVDRDFRILSANRVFCNRFGVRPEEIIGRPLPCCHEIQLNPLL